MVILLDTSIHSVGPSRQVQELFAQPGEVCVHRAICEQFFGMICHGILHDFTGLLPSIPRGVRLYVFFLFYTFFHQL